MITDTVTIVPQHLVMVQDILKACLLPTAQVYVFGSRARGTTKRAADLDLAIDAGRALTAQESLELWDQFEQSDLPYKVDVVDLHTIKPEFKSMIERDMIALSF